MFTAYSRNSITVLDWIADFGIKDLRNIYKILHFTASVVLHATDKYVTSISYKTCMYGVSKKRLTLHV